MTNHYITPVTYDRALADLITTREARIQAFQRQITPDLAQEVVNLSQNYGGVLPSGAVMGLAQYRAQTPVEARADVTEDQMVQQTVQGAAETDWWQEDGWLRRGLRGAVRTTLTAMEGAFDWGVGAPLRGLGHDIDSIRTGTFGSEEHQQDQQKLMTSQTHFGRALRGVVKGEGADLGEGFLWGGQVAAEQYAERGELEEPQGKMALQRYADPTSPEHDPAFAQKLRGLHLNAPTVRGGQPVSIGRAIAIGEPDSAAYNFMSGLIDGAVQWYADPVDRFVGRPAAAIARSKRAFGLLDQFGRPVVDRQATVQNFIRGKAGQRLSARIAQIDNFEDMYLLLTNEGKNTGLDRSFIREAVSITEAKDAQRFLEHGVGWDQIDDIAASGGAPLGGIGVQLQQRPQLNYSRLRQARLPIVNKQLADVRLLNDMPGPHIVMNNLDAGTKDFRNWLINATIPAGTRKELMERYSRVYDQDALAEVMLDAAGAIDAQIAEAGLNFGGKGGRPINVVENTQRAIFDSFNRLGDDLAAAASAPVPFDDWKVPVTLGSEDITDLLVRGQTHAEYLATAVPLIDSRSIKRQVSDMWALADVFPWIGDTIRLGVDGMESFMGNVWKPLQLARLAWTARVIGEGQIRMAGSGLKAPFFDPSAWRDGASIIFGAFTGRIVMKNADMVIDATGMPLQAIKEFRAAMTRNGGHYMNRAGITARTGEYVAYQRPGTEAGHLPATDIVYANVWADNLATHMEDELFNKTGQAMAGGFEMQATKSVRGQGIIPAFSDDAADATRGVPASVGEWQAATSAVRADFIERVQTHVRWSKNNKLVDEATAHDMMEAVRRADGSAEGYQIVEGVMADLAPTARGRRANREYNLQRRKLATTNQLQNLSPFPEENWQRINRLFDVDETTGRIIPPDNPDEILHNAQARILGEEFSDAISRGIDNLEGDEFAEFSANLRAKFGDDTDQVLDEMRDVVQDFLAFDDDAFGMSSFISDWNDTVAEVTRSPITDLESPFPAGSPLAEAFTGAKMRFYHGSGRADLELRDPSIATNDNYENLPDAILGLNVTPDRNFAREYATGQGRLHQFDHDIRRPLEFDGDYTDLNQDVFKSWEKVDWSEEDLRELYFIVTGGEIPEGRPIASLRREISEVMDEGLAASTEAHLANHGFTRRITNAYREDLTRQGYDAVHIMRKVDGEGDHWIILDPQRALRPVDEALAKTTETTELLTGRDAVKEWYFNDPNGSQLRTDLAKSQADAAKHHLNKGGEIVADAPVTNLAYSRELSDQYVDDVFEKLQHLTGGDEELIQGVLSGKLRGHKIDVDSAASMRAVRKVLKEKIDKGIGPDVLVGPKFYSDPNVNFPERARKGIDTIFDMLMSAPENMMARSPAWAQIYTDTLLELAPHIKADQLPEAIKNLKGLQGAKGVRKDLIESLGKVQQHPTMAYDLGLINDLAKKRAMDGTKNLLYDVARRSQMADTFSIISPFFEAYREVMMTWGRMVRDNPALLRRGSQVVDGARGSGIFYENENGEEVFSYPMLNQIYSAVAGTPTDAEANVNSLNLVASSVLPGVGPAVQWTASTDFLQPGGWMDELLSTFGVPGAVDTFHQQVLPFGNEDVSTFGALIDSTAPAWLSQVLNGLWGGGGKVNPRAFENTVGGIMKSNVLSGRFAANEVDANHTAARKTARWLTIVRGGANMIVPATARPKVKVEDINGNFVQIDALAQDYRKMIDKHGGDNDVALHEFLEVYGMDPMVLAQATTRQVTPRSVGDLGGWEWEMANKGRRHQLPGTFGYWAPVTNEPAPYAAFQQAMEDNDIESLTGKQQIMLANNAIGNMRWFAMKDSLDLMEGLDEQAKTDFLAGYNAQLKTELEGYDTFIPGVASRPSFDQQMTEVRVAAADPTFNSPAKASVARYLQFRDQVELLLETQNGVTLKAAKTAKRHREVLKQYGDAIALADPHFLQIWERVLSREVS